MMRMRQFPFAQCHVCRSTTDIREMDFHHPNGRIGDNLFNFVTVCRPCHNWIHQNPKKAKELGYLKTNS